MNDELLHSDCASLRDKLTELKKLREDYGVETSEFKGNPKYEKENYQVMMSRLDELETTFQQQYLSIIQLLLPAYLTAEIFRELKEDYEQQTKTLLYFNLIEADPERPGRYFYKPNYDGTDEPGNNGINFVGKKFLMPRLGEILKMMTEEQVYLYEDMKQLQLNPRLQLTPIGYKLASMAKKLDEKRADINAKAGRIKVATFRETYVGDQDSGIIANPKIEETKLVYFDTETKRDQNFQEITFQKRLFKSALIRKYNGWMPQIVSMKSVPSGVKTERRFGFKNLESGPESVGAYLEQAKLLGYSGMGCDDYLMAVLNSLMDDQAQPLDQVYHSHSLQSNTILLSEVHDLDEGDKKIIAYWDEDQFNIICQRGIIQNDCWFRRSIKIFPKK